MNNGDLKTTIMFYLKHGQDNAIKKLDLAMLCHCNERVLRLAIRELIDEGNPICGSPHPPHGYFIANTEAEANAELRMMRYGYGRELHNRYKAFKNASYALLHPGQLRLKL